MDWQSFGRFSAPHSAHFLRRILSGLRLRSGLGGHILQGGLKEGFHVAAFLKGSCTTSPEGFSQHAASQAFGFSLNWEQKLFFGSLTLDRLLRDPPNPPDPILAIKPFKDGITRDPADSLRLVCR